MRGIDKTQRYVHTHLYYSGQYNKMTILAVQAQSWLRMETDKQRERKRERERYMLKEESADKNLKM